MNPPPLRDDLRALEGYHSPQLNVDVRLNTNEAAVGPPAEFVRQLGLELEKISWNRYPDRSGTALRASIAQRFGLDTGSVYVANGSNEVIQTLLLAYGGPGRVAMTFTPTYAMYAQIARVSNTALLSLPRDEDFLLDLDTGVLAIEEHKPSLVFVCSPNNPTGITESQATLRTLLEAVESVGGLLVVDEAYGEFSSWSALELLMAGSDSLVITKTYSKTWSMAAARLGFMLGPTDLVAQLEMVTLPYHLDSFKQAAGIVALDFWSQMQDRVAKVVLERTQMAQSLTELGAKVWPSEANFLLFRAPEQGPEAWPLAGSELWQALVERSVLIRDSSNWPQLEGCLRVTIGTSQENDRFIEALTEVLASEVI